MRSILFIALLFAAGCKPDYNHQLYGNFDSLVNRYETLKDQIRDRDQLFSDTNYLKSRLEYTRHRAKMRDLVFILGKYRNDHPDISITYSTGPDSLSITIQLR